MLGISNLYCRHTFVLMNSNLESRDEKLCYTTFHVLYWTLSLHDSRQMLTDGES